MTTWTMEQVWAVRRTHSNLWVDDTALAVGGDPVVDAARARVTRELIEACRVHAVEVNPLDVDFAVTPGTFGGVRIRATWRPSSHEVEFVGGPADGQRFAVMGAGREYVVVAVAPPTLGLLARADAAELLGPEPITPERVTYVPTGWHEAERRWVYGVQRGR